MPRILRLVPRPRISKLDAVGLAYRHLLIGLLVLIAGCLVLTIALSLLGL